MGRCAATHSPEVLPGRKVLEQSPGFDLYCGETGEAAKKPFIQQQPFMHAIIQCARLQRTVTFLKGGYFLPLFYLSSSPQGCRDEGLQDKYI